MVYSVTSMASLEGLRHINDSIVRAKGNDPTFPRLIVGNKIDLESERTVTYEDAQKFANELGGLPIIETSAKTGHNVKKVFFEMVLELLLYLFSLGKNH